MAVVVEVVGLKFDCRSVVEKAEAKERHLGRLRPSWLDGHPAMPDVERTRHRGDVVAPTRRTWPEDDQISVASGSIPAPPTGSPRK